MSAVDDRPVFRFAPSPNGHLHLGHAYSALVNQSLCNAVNGQMLLRIEDIDTARCTQQLEKDMLEDLLWLGFEWVEEPRRQSSHFADYREALSMLIDADLAYPSTMSRGELRAIVERSKADGEAWPHDPDGAPLHPGRDYEASSVNDGDDAIWRLDVAAAKTHLGVETVAWEENGFGPDGETGLVVADPAAWGDFVLARRDTPTSYHLSVVVDDALQGITHVVRGRDLFHATSAHSLLQDLFGYPKPRYFHHDLILQDGTDRKLSKSAKDTSLRALRNAGATPSDIKRMVGV
ncbi:MAG: tRNA glutamyl-Q(34) synthetase GluQRS [Pseudomonadota bacterium]